MTFDPESWDFFNFNLPQDRIAQRPSWEPGSVSRGSSKLLSFVQGVITDYSFDEVLKVLRPNDILILNNTRVIHSRFFTEIGELLLCSPVSIDGSECWLALAKPLKKFVRKARFPLTETVEAEVLGTEGRFLKLKIHGDIETGFAEMGRIPIPPYIRKGVSDERDAVDYQTVYAEEVGSVAAPTAGLHFSKEHLQRIREYGVDIEYVTLHVGPASFLGITSKPPPEKMYVPSKVWEKVCMQKESGARVIAVGTTAMRTLETMGSKNAPTVDTWAETDLFIQPGFEYKIVDACFTNFHQPKSTHLLMIGAFIGTTELERVYGHALESEYRFFSYGDSSFLFPHGASE